MKLSFSGWNQFVYAHAWSFPAMEVVRSLTQINYLNKPYMLALDTFNTAVISHVYHVMFTTFTIIASMIMFRDRASQDATQIRLESCGFITIVSGTFLHHKTEDVGNSMTTEPTIPSESELHSDSKRMATSVDGRTLIS